MLPSPVPVEECRSAEHAEGLKKRLDPRWTTRMDLNRYVSLGIVGAREDVDVLLWCLHVCVRASEYFAVLKRPPFHSNDREGWVVTQLNTTLDVDCYRWMDWFHGGLQFQVCVCGRPWERCGGTTGGRLAQGGG